LPNISACNLIELSTAKEHVILAREQQIKIILNSHSIITVINLLTFLITTLKIINEIIFNWQADALIVHKN